MPNGNDRNWVRARAALEGFFVRFGHWPTRLRLPPRALQDLRCNLFTAASLRVLESKLALVPDLDAPMVAEDEDGNRYSYGTEGFPRDHPTPGAEEWLGVAPDAPFAHEG